MKRVNKKAFNDLVQKVIAGDDADFTFKGNAFRPSGGACVHYVNLIKVKGVEKYDIIVSIDSLDTSMWFIRELIDYVCTIEDIDYRKILIEL